MLLVNGMIRVSKEYEKKLNTDKNKIENILGLKINMTQFTKIKSAIEGDMIIIEKPRKHKFRLKIRKQGIYF